MLCCVYRHGEYRNSLFADCRLSVESELLSAVLVYLPMTQASAISMIVSVVLLPFHFE